MQCCPHAGVLFVPILRPPRPQNDDEFEKYEPRPKIVIEKRDFELSRPYYNGALGESFEPTVPSLRISAQHVNQKDAVIVKIISLHGCSLLVDDATQVRLSVSNQKTKHQTAIARGQEPVFNQTFTITGLNRDTLLSSTLRFRVYSRTGKSRMNLRAEGTLEGHRLSQHGLIPYTITLTPLINTVKSEIPPEILMYLNPCTVRVCKLRCSVTGAVIL
nr:C2 calcium-dependent membrane targeting domain containing protein [Haemonchus contortus]